MEIFKFRKFQLRLDTDDDHVIFTSFPFDDNFHVPLTRLQKNISRSSYINTEDHC